MGGGRRMVNPEDEEEGIVKDDEGGEGWVNSDDMVGSECDRATDSGAGSEALDPFNHCFAGCLWGLECLRGGGGGTFFLACSSGNSAWGYFTVTNAFFPNSDSQSVV